MGTINTENLEAGMVLLNDVKSGNQVLLAKGATLTNKHINVFKSWGVNAVEVEGVSEQEVTDKKLENISPQARLIIENELNEKFRHVDLKFYPAKALFNACLLKKID